MIEAQNISKQFDGFWALENVSCRIERGSIYGMVGSNGAGKSTLLRILSGIYRPNSGTVLLDGAPVYENPAAKAKIAFVPDALYFPAGATVARMMAMYRNFHASFDRARCEALCKELNLDLQKPIQTFSKGMKRQCATVLALCTDPEYILFDETFDGLDPVMRNYVKRLICMDVVDRGASAVITSHSLRELEDTCDQLALLHKGGIVFESDIQNLRTTRFKIQIAFAGESDYGPERFEGLDIVRFTKHGSVVNMIVKGDRDETVEKLRAMSPAILDVLPLTLEEVFTYEMEALGYSFQLD